MKIIHLTACLTLLAVFTACSSTPQTSVDDGPAPKRLRVLTYNIHHGRGTDGVFDYQRLADVINLVNPDLVALQEVDRATGRSSGVDQAAKLGELTGMHSHFAQAMPFDGGSYGEAVLSRFPILVTGDIELPCDAGQEPRAVAGITVEPWGSDGPSVVFAGTHLCHQSADTRLAQAKQINVSFPQVHQRTLIAGDFNFTSNTAAYNELARRWTDTALIAGSPQPTMPSSNPRSRIDYVFARPAGAWRIVEVRVLDEPIASDHAPVLVVLEVVESQQTESIRFNLDSLDNFELTDGLRMNPRPE